MTNGLAGQDLVGQRLGLSRRAFVQICAGIAATLGLGLSEGKVIAQAILSKRRPPVIWLHFAECTGCTESMLRSEHPALDRLLLELISLDYHETLFAGAGHQAEEARDASMAENKGKYVLVVEGAIPTAENGIYCKIGGKTALEIVRNCSEGAAAVIALGSCAAWGGMPSTAPNPTGCTGVGEILGKTVVNIPGCPPNPYNFLSTVIHYITYGRLPELDAQGRPKFAYGRLIHENCERRPHFDAGRFAQQFGDDGHRQGWCLYRLGCKGPETYANCPSILFCDAGSGSWPVGTGHPCIGCTEKGVGFAKPIHALADLKYVGPIANSSRIIEPQGNGINVVTAAVAAGVAGVLIGAAAIKATQLSNEPHPEEEHSQKEEKP
jgi:hydrogenase small subunit